jgi:glycerol-3-phosphate dehydrogenase
MGPCQGGFCTFRAAGIVHEMASRQKSAPSLQGAPWDVGAMTSPAHAAVAQVAETLPGPSALQSPATPNLLLRDFLQERWRGLTPILWGQQLKQERLDELIYLSVLNADHLPADEAQSPLSEFWQFDTTPQ